MKKAAIAGACLALLGLLALVLFWSLTEDPDYALREFLSGGGYRQHDELILAAAQRYSVSPALIKAVIWRESRFEPGKVGTQGERGLMQVTEGAATDWVKAEKIETFVPTDLFDPKVNIEVGTWYLSRALSHWSAKDDPVPFALAEFNAGRSRVKRWVKDSGQGEVAQANDLRSAMDFPATKSYISSIQSRAAFYEKRGEPAR